MTSTNPSQTYLYMLYNEINYNPLCKEYYNILTLNKQPEGTLKEYTKLINIILPSTNQNYNKQCSYAILNSLLNNTNTNTNTNTKYSNFLMLEDLNEFTEFLINNTYIIDNSITKLYKNNSFKSSNSKKLIYSFKITL
jgi:hypothetical protein